MSRRPKIEEAMEKVESRYELVHAAIKRTLQILEEGEDFFVRTEEGLIKKTFKAIEDVAEGKVRIIRREQLNE